jgi:hypothetical protein
MTAAIVVFSDDSVKGAAAALEEAATDPTPS